MTSIKLLIVCTLINLSLGGCALPSWVPEAPEVNRCTYSLRFQKWRCKDSKTGAVEDRRLDDPRMENAEAISKKDSLKMSKWLDDVLKLANSHCH